MKLMNSQLRIALCAVAAASVAGAATPVASEAEAALSGVTIREESRQLVADQNLSINSICDDDEVSLGGGVRWAGGSSLLNNRILGIESRSQFGRGIRSTIRDHEPGGTDTAIAIAVCAPGAGLPVIGVGDEEDGEASGGPQTASCNPPETAIFGSVFTQSPALGMQAIAESRPTDVDGDGVASSWRGRYLNEADPDALFVVQVLCAEPSDDFTVEAASSPFVPLPPGGLAVATAACPRADQIAIGGGVSTNGASFVGLVASQPGTLVGGQPRSWTVISAAPPDGITREISARVMCTTQGPPPPPPPPATPTPPQPPGTSAASVAFDSKSKLRLTRKRTANLALTCSAAAGQRCQGTLALKGAKGKAKRILKARPVSFSIPGGTTERLKLKLSRKAQKLVGRAGKSGARAKVTATLAGQAPEVSRVVRLVGRGSRPTVRRSSTTAGADGQITHERKEAHQR